MNRIDTLAITPDYELRSNTQNCVISYPSSYLGFDWYPRHHYCYPPQKELKDFTNAEIVAELKRRKLDRDVLDQIEIKEAK